MDHTHVLKGVAGYKSPTQGLSRMSPITAHAKFGKGAVQSAIAAGHLQHDRDAGTLLVSHAGVKAMGGKRVFNAARKAITIGPRGGVYEISKTGKRHSLGRTGIRGGGKNAANHEGGLVHHPSHDCPGGGLKHEEGMANCGRVKKEK